MWESLKDIFISDNFGSIIIGICALIILLAYLVKKGIFSFKGKGLTVGISNEEELSIVRKQIEFCKIHSENLSNMLLSYFKNDNEWHIKYVSELIFDMWIKAISFNNITKDSFYIQNKFEIIWSILSREGLKDETIKKYIKNECKKVVERLVDIKEYYSEQ